MKFEWERISTVSGSWCLYETERAKVIGGWIVRSTNYLSDDNDADSDAWENTSVAMIFISDPKHLWEAERV